MVTLSFHVPRSSSLFAKIALVLKMILRMHSNEVKQWNNVAEKINPKKSAKLNPNFSIRNLLFQCDANVEVTTFDGYTPLHLASASGSYEISSYLLFHGANPEIKSIAENLTPLDLAPSEKVFVLTFGKNVVNFRWFMVSCLVFSINKGQVLPVVLLS